jgi:hypothetical protein
MERKPRKNAKKSKNQRPDPLPQLLSQHQQPMTFSQISLPPVPLPPVPLPKHYDSSIIYEQDYEYELSLIADMEKREKREMEEIRVLSLQQKLADLDTRNFHIKQILRKLKLGIATSSDDIKLIHLLESWMESENTCLQTDLMHSLYSCLDNKIRVPIETKDYMKQHVYE